MSAAMCAAGLERIAQLPHVVERFRSGELVFDQGEECNAVYLVQEGSVELSFKDDRQRKYRLRIALPGDLLGLPAAVGARPYSKAAIALKDTTLHRIETKQFLQFLEANPECRLVALTCLNEDTIAMQALFKRLLMAPNIAV